MSEKNYNFQKLTPINNAELKIYDDALNFVFDNDDIKNVALDRSNVIIKGAEYKLKTVATVKALIDIDNLSKQQQGEITLKDVKLVAYDTDGKIVNVEIVPEKINATLTIISPNKVVPVKIIPKGDLAFGKSIQSITSSITSMKVYGDQSTIDKIEYVPVEIDITNLDSDKEYNVNISKPTGIRELEVKTITVKIKLDTLTTKEIPGVSILTRNLNSDYKVTALSEADSKVTVVVKGSKSVLDNLDSSTIRAYIDLGNYGIGEHEVDVQVEGDDLRLSYASKTKKVKISISKK